MPIRSHVDPTRRLVLTTAEGVVDDDDIRRVRRDLAEDPAFERGFHQLVDMTGVTRVDVSFDTRRLVADDPSFGPGSRRAIVADEPHQIGFARQYALMSSAGGRTDSVEVFPTRQEAEAWLGID